MIFQMVWVLELAYSGWLFIIFDYGCSLACSFFFFLKSASYLGVGKLVILGHLLRPKVSQPHGLRQKMNLLKKPFTKISGPGLQTS